MHWNASRSLLIPKIVRISRAVCLPHPFNGGYHAVSNCVLRSVIPCMRSERCSAFTHHAQTVDSLLTLLALVSPIRGDLTAVYTNNRLSFDAVQLGMAEESRTA